MRALLLLSQASESFDLARLTRTDWQVVTDRYPALSHAFDATVLELEGGSEWVEKAIRDLDLPEE